MGLLFEAVFRGIQCHDMTALLACIGVYTLPSWMLAGLTEWAACGAWYEGCMGILSGLTKSTEDPSG